MITSLPGPGPGPGPRPLSPHPAIRAVLAGFGLLLLLWADASLVVPLKELNIPNSGNDFGVFWSGTRTVLQGQNPYLTGPGSTYRDIVIAGGGNLQPLEPYITPYYLTLLTLPYALLPLGMAASLWVLTMQGLLGVAVVMIIRATAPPFTLKAALLAAGLVLLWRYTFLVMMIGNVTLLLVFGLTASFYFTRTGRPGLAGAAVAVLLIKPQVVFLIGPLLLFAPGEGGWLNRDTYRRWRGFAIAAAIFGVYSFGLMPGWVGEWLKAVFGTDKSYFSNRSVDGDMTSLRGVIALLLPDRGLVQPVLIGVSLPLWLWLGWLWWRHRRRADSLPYLLSLAIALNVMTTPYIRDYDYALLLFNLLWAYFRLRHLEALKLPPPGLWRASGLLWLVALLPLGLQAGHLWVYQNFNLLSRAAEPLVPLTFIALTLWLWRQSGRPDPKTALAPLPI